RVAELVARRFASASLEHELAVDAELDEGHERRAEERVEPEDELAAHHLHLLLPGRVKHGYDQMPPIETKRAAAARELLARHDPPGSKCRLLARLIRVAGLANEHRKQFEQALHSADYFAASTPPPHRSAPLRGRLEAVGV